MKHTFPEGPPKNEAPPRDGSQGRQQRLDKLGETLDYRTRLVKRIGRLRCKFWRGHLDARDGITAILEGAL
jgi:hypothetical protein